MRVELCDVGPRDGLQNEARVLPPAVRAELCRKLAAAGLARVEAASFVRADQVPAMADAEGVVAALPSRSATKWTGLVLNRRGYDRAVAAGLEQLTFLLAATETFSQRNQGCTVDDSVRTALELAGRAERDGVTLTVTVAVAFGCPFEGDVPPRAVLHLVEGIRGDVPPTEIVLADTIGVAVPTQVRELVGQVVRQELRCGGHFHDTRNTGIANALAALESGASLLDAGVGGSGGCPFAPGATGNVATEDLVWVLERMGVDTGVDLDRLIECSRWLAAQLGHELPAAVPRAGLPPRSISTRA